MVNVMVYPLVICYIAIENGPVEIVDFPMKNGWLFHSYVAVYQAGYILLNPIKSH